MTITAEKQADYIAQWRHNLHQSKYVVERQFNSLPLELKQIVIALADLTTGDLYDLNSKGYKLHHYTTSGQLKIAESIKKCRAIANHFPNLLTRKDFTLIDKEIDHAGN